MLWAAETDGFEGFWTDWDMDVFRAESLDPKIPEFPHNCWVYSMCFNGFPSFIMWEMEIFKKKNQIQQNPSLPTQKLTAIGFVATVGTIRNIITALVLGDAGDGVPFISKNVVL